jgi:hypothetical protein
MMGPAAFLLMFVVLPAWIVAGLADYACHRATRIAETSGVAESLLHLLQFGLVGLPVTLALFVKPNAGFFLFAGLCILLHHLTAYLDVRYANHTRPGWPVEQMVHSFLEIPPIAAFLLLAATEWRQFLALFGLGSEVALFQPQPRPLPLAYMAAALAGAFLFNLLPYLEELVRCLRAARLSRFARRSTAISTLDQRRPIGHF